MQKVADTPTLVPPAPTTAVAPGEGATTPVEKVSTAGTWYLLGGLVVLFFGFIALLIWRLRKK